MTVRQVVRVKIPNLTHFYGCEIFHNRTVKCVTLDILTLTPRVTIIPSVRGLSPAIFQPKNIDKEKLSVHIYIYIFCWFHGTLNFVNIWCTFNVLMHIRFIREGVICFFLTGIGRFTREEVFNYF